MKIRSTIKISILILILVPIAFNVHSQKVIKLWGSLTPPSSNEESGPMMADTFWTTHVVTPDITIYYPTTSMNKHTAVVICPGGGYSGLAYKHEGHQLAKWLQDQGITGVVLRYRLPNGHKEVPLEDAHQAIFYLRTHLTDTYKIGIAGFSAGGHLAATVSTHPKIISGISANPDFAILIYPVITMSTGTHVGSRNELLGINPTSEDIDYFSNERHVTTNTPPTLIMLSNDDDAVSPIENGVNYFNALLANKVPASMYVFPIGNHGWGMNKSFQYHNQMLELLKMWLDENI